MSAAHSDNTGSLQATIERNPPHAAHSGWPFRASFCALWVICFPGVQFYEDYIYIPHEVRLRRDYNRGPVYIHLQKDHIRVLKADFGNAKPLSMHRSVAASVPRVKRLEFPMGQYS